MKIKIINSLILFFALFAMASCSISPEAAEKQADVFYEKLKQHDYEGIKGMLDEEALNANTWEEWLKILSDKEKLGELVSYEIKTGFNSNYYNGLNTISLKYTVKYSDINLYEYIKFVKRGEEYKVYVYAYYDTEKMRDEMAESYE